MAESLTLAELLKKSFDSLSPAERRVSRVLIADYPVAGLEPVHRLAERANVSAPTVLRLLSKLGIGSYPDMQKLLHGEISARTSSPIEMYGESAGRGGTASEGGILERSRQVLTRGIEATFASIPVGEFESIVELLAAPKRRIWTAGGRFSGLLAEYLSMHLKLLRRDVQHISATDADRSFALLDFGPRDIVVVFDYRRYQNETIRFLKQAKQQKATTILITDPWLSPAAKHADHLLSNSVVAPSPFDSLTPGFALIETLIAAVVDSLGDEPKERVRSFDQLEAQRQDHPTPDTE